MSGIFHRGERAAQVLAGESAMADRNGGGLQTQLMPGALPFLSQSRMIVLTAEDSGGALWTTVTFGMPGFIVATERQAFHIDTSLALPCAGDPVWCALRTGARLGALVIDLSTRRRLRINGIVHNLSDSAMHVRVEEVFANCPKYISQREVRVMQTSAVQLHKKHRHGATLEKAMKETIEQADMLFLGSIHAERGVDSSHRGGHPGFVQVVAGNRLRLPDYKGNSMFQSFGNLLLDQRSSMAIPNFSGGHLLHLSGCAEVRWHEFELENGGGGTGRSLEFAVHRWKQTPFPEQVSSEFLGYSPFNPASS